MFEHNSSERSLEKVGIALERLVKDKHLQLPLTGENNKYLILNWIDPMFNGVAPNYTLRAFFDRKQRGYTSDVCDKVFSGLYGMTEQAYLIRFFEKYWQRDREEIFSFQEDFQELNEGLKEELREVVYQVRQRENVSKEEYSIMIGIFFLDKAHKLGLVQPYGCFLKHALVEVDEALGWGMKEG